jgi:hypothetical protein
VTRAVKTQVYQLLFLMNEDRKLLLLDIVSITRGLKDFAENFSSLHFFILLFVLFIRR